MEPKTIEMAALGRSLYPGMLYDCRSDSFIPGVTLWDKSSLTQDLDVRRQPNTDLKFSASDSLREKASLLDVSSSLKASFLGGLVEVGGSAKYLRDQKSSTHQSRVTLQYSQTTRYEQLTMTQLGKITYPEVFEEKTATHVVTAVLYGSQVFMVFDRTTAENEDKQEVEGKLNVMVKKILSFSMEGQGDLKMNENEKNLAENISCTFYGDCVLEENPSTYLEALQLHKKLPSLLRQRENDAVPVKVWLYPLARLDSRAAKLEREISETVISKVESVLEELGDAERRFKDLLKNRTVNDFQDVKERLELFQESFEDYKVLFQKALCRLLPAIRSGEMNMQALTDILLIHHSSPFSTKKLKQWLENIQGEVNLLNSYTRELSDVPVITSSVLNNILFDPMVDTVVCFSLTSLKYEDPYLSTISEFLKVDEFEKLTVLKSRDQDIQAWFRNPEISEKMRSNLFLFKSLSEANKENGKTRFVVASVSDSSNPGTSIHLYRKGKMLDNNFQPVSKPPAPTVDVQDRNVILKLQKPPTGETVRYRVEYRARQPSDSGADDGNWEFTDTPDTQETFTLTGLQLANQYWVRYRAVSDVGVSEASDSVLISLQGKVNVSVGQCWDGTTSSLYSGLRNKIMTSLGSSWWSQSIIQSEVTNRLSNISTPYEGEITGGLKPGMALYFQGVGYRGVFMGFAINYDTGPSESDDTVMDFNFVNSYAFQALDLDDKYFLYEGSAFDIFIVTTTEGYEVYVNLREPYLVKHRMPVENVTTLYVNGDVLMNTIGIVPNWSTSTFGKELGTENSQGRLSNIQSHVEHPVCNPSKSYVGPITGGLRAGLALFFQGIVASDSDGFAINLKTGPRDGDDIALQFKQSDSAGVCSSFREGKMGDQKITISCQFDNGGAFDIVMAVNPEGYEIIVNGHSYCTFNHHIPLEDVSVINISGDVFMNTFSIVEVDSVNLKVIKHART